MTSTPPQPQETTALAPPTTEREPESPLAIATESSITPSSQPKRDAVDQELFVVFRVGDADYGLPAREVLQMESFTGATPVPGSRPFVIGIIQLRGRVVPVIDLRLRFGFPAASAPTLESRVVVAESAVATARGRGSQHHRAVALLVDRAREVVRIPSSALKPPPRLVDDSGFVRAIVQLENRTILILDFEKVIGGGEEPTVDV